MERCFILPDLEPFSSWLAMRSTSGYAVSCPRLPLLAPPDSAGGGLARARVVRVLVARVMTFFVLFFVFQSLVWLVAMVRWTRS